MSFGSHLGAATCPAFWGKKTLGSVFFNSSIGFTLFMLVVSKGIGL